MAKWTQQRTGTEQSRKDRIEKNRRCSGQKEEYLEALTCAGEGELKGFCLFADSMSSLTSVGEVTLISGVAAASNRLMIFSVFNSFDGVTFGGGGTAGLS